MLPLTPLHTLRRKLRVIHILAVGRWPIKARKTCHQTCVIVEMSPLSVLCILVGAVAAEASMAVVLRVFGGSDAKVGQFPYLVSLRRMHDEHFCGGSIIANNWVLSAAHCTEGEMANPSNFFVMSGALRIRGEGNRHNPDFVANHPLYNKAKIDNDISLIRVVRPFLGLENVRSVQLPTSDIPNGTNLQARVAGWGDMNVSIRFCDDSLDITANNQLSSTSSSH